MLMESVQLRLRLVATVANHHLARQRVQTTITIVIVICQQNPNKDALIR